MEVIGMSGIAEARNADNFLEWIQDDDKRYVIIITDDKKAYYRPTKSTPKLDTVFVVNLNEEGMGKIKDKAKTTGLIVRECLRYNIIED